MQTQFTKSQVAVLLDISKRQVSSLEKQGKLESNNGFYSKDQLEKIPGISRILNSNWELDRNVKPSRQFRNIELFAGTGGMSLGFEQAGFSTELFNEFDKPSCDTLRKNRPDWNVLEGDIRDVCFKQYRGLIDMVSGGFPCQTFSYAGNMLGFDDVRGTMFYEFMRAIVEIQPRVFIAENVPGLLTHDNGRTFETIKSIIDEKGYDLVFARVVRTVLYEVPQKRERVILVAIRKDLSEKAIYTPPAPCPNIVSLRDALTAGRIHSTDVPDSPGQVYPDKKAKIMAMVPEGGNWRDLPERVQKEYMGKSILSGGGKTGAARRLSWDDPGYTLTCSPSQKLTESCHPTENRPLTVREYARLQTFPDNWEFCGSMTDQYRQIGNAVPVNFAFALGTSMMRLLNDLE